MQRPARLSLALVCALSLSRCTEAPPPPPPQPLTIELDREEVTADGQSTVVVTVSSAKSPVKLTTTQGVWQGTDKRSLEVEGNGEATLVTCDSRVTSGCGVRVKVAGSTAEGQAGSAFVQFLQLEICSNALDDDGDGLADCADLQDCADAVCLLPEGAVGTGVCTSGGSCVCDTGTAEVCGDGMDNNCDGKVDCADPACNNEVCALPSGANGVCKSSKCACPGTAEVCGNGVDDDCDNRIDCDDDACQATGTAAGKVCDPSKNLTCSAPDGAGKATCTVCAGSEPDGERSCGDGKDNDCDGLADCLDADCAQDSCGANGRTCTAAMACACSGNGGTPEDSEGTCDDGSDNDCDGLADCADPDCASDVCGSNGKVCNAQKQCVCTGGGGTAQASENLCNDGFDNDCDGLIDCAETDCRPSGNVLGKVCDANGNTCSPAVNGVSSCSICSGGGGVAQATETYCFDNADNDCDGLKDCLDPDCAGNFCSTTGRVCSGTTFTCDCPGGSVESSCSDGVDNDCDGLLDCKDLVDCQPIGGVTKSCGANGFSCNAAGNCACSGNGGAPQATETSCGDGFDNDCDGFVDCQDTNCRPAGTVAGKDCSAPNGTPPTVGMKCDAVGQCVCPNGQASETLCGDSVDNDCDGLLDCQDPDCDALSCGGFGQVCSFTAKTCSCPGGTIESCGDLVDNNCNGKVDCDEPNGACANQQCSSNPNYQCTVSTGTTYVCKDITSSVTLTMTAAPTRIAANGAAISLVTLTLKDGNTLLTNKQVTLAVSSGTGTVSPSTVTTDGQGKATATYTAGTAGGVNVVTATYFTGTQNVTGTVAIDTPAVGQVKFDSQQHSIMGVRYSSFQEVNDITFQVLDSANQPYPPGLTVSFTHTPVGGSYIGTTPNCTQSTCTASGVTDGQGKVKISLRSGTVASVVSVVASAAGGGGSGTATASNIAIVGAKVSGSYISINCTPKNVPALTANDCLTSQHNATINCTAAFADRFNNILGVGTIVNFNSEAGAATATAQSDSKTGLAKVGVSVQGFSLPKDVAPFPGEHEYTAQSACGTQRTYNPRDGLATIIVSANGEEGFVDGSNGKPSNGVYDPGENFIDIGEPFVDANDNGVRDADEPYVDYNNNGVWNGPNGTWDSNTLVWAQTRVLYTGRAHIAYDANGYHASRWYLTGAPPVSSTRLPPNFSVLSSASGGPTVESLGVYFADENFNQLNPATTFGVSVISGNVQAKFNTTPNSVDSLGMTFTQQYCSTPTGTGCSNTCSSSPCYVVTTVGNYAYGNYGIVEIKGGSQPSPSAEVRATSTYGGVTTQLSVMGDVQ